MKKRYQLCLDLGKQWEQEKDKRNQPETEEENHDVGWSTATLICGGIEDLWEEFVMCKENEKEKKEEEPQKETIVKEGAEKIRQFSMGQLRKRDAKGAVKDKEPRVHKDKEIEGISNCLHRKHQAIEVHPLFLVAPAQMV